MVLNGYRSWKLPYSYHLGILLYEVLLRALLDYVLMKTRFALYSSHKPSVSAFLWTNLDHGEMSSCSFLEIQLLFPCNFSYQWQVVQVQKLCQKSLHLLLLQEHRATGRLSLSTPEFRYGRISKFDPSWPLKSSEASIFQVFLRSIKTPAMMLLGGYTHHLKVLSRWYFANLRREKLER